MQGRRLASRSRCRFSHSLTSSAGLLSRAQLVKNNLVCEPCAGLVGAQCGEEMGAEEHPRHGATIRRIASARGTGARAAAHSVLLGAALAACSGPARASPACHRTGIIL